MKPHVRIKLRNGVDPPDLPAWSEVIGRDEHKQDRFLPAVDRLFAQRRLCFMATREYLPAGEAWSAAERASGLDRVYRLVLTRNTSIPPDLIADIRLLPQVEDARTGAVGHMDLAPRTLGDRTRTDRASREAIFLEEAHAYGRGEPEVTVAILDTGLELEHPEYRDSLEPGRDFVDILNGAEDFIGDHIQADEEPADEVGHGTHVAGILAGRGRNMPMGVAPRCRLLPVRVLAAMRRDGRTVGAGLIENINTGVKWAVDRGADVINMSLGVRHTGGGLPHEEVIDYCLRRGVTVVAASGNDGRQELYYPGALPPVIAVGAMDADGKVADFSTFGDHVSFVAPGVDVYSTALDGGYAFSTGTSHAAPFVSGAVALLKSYAASQGRRLCDRQVKHVLKHTSDKVDQRFKDRKAGYGRLNLADALRYLDWKLNAGRRPSHEQH
jgi:subtilisin family serine protease